MNERRITFTIFTDDIVRSISLYRDALGLKMRPLCNPIIMFPLGEAEFEVCHRQMAEQLVGRAAKDAGCQGLQISLAWSSHAEVQMAKDAALSRGGATQIDADRPGEVVLHDFNGVIWRLSCPKPQA